MVIVLLLLMICLFGLVVLVVRVVKIFYCCCIGYGRCMFLIRMYWIIWSNIIFWKNGVRNWFIIVMFIFWIGNFGKCLWRILVLMVFGWGKKLLKVCYMVVWFIMDLIVRLLYLVMECNSLMYMIMFSVGCMWLGYWKKLF